MNEQIDWFYNTFSNHELAEILADAHEQVFGKPLWLDAGRCTLARRLEEVFAQADNIVVPQ